jgi:hypothetical protein
MVAAAWGALGYGLIFSAPDRQVWDDLEGGGRFAANFLVYLPYLGMTLPITVVVILGLLRAPDLLFPLVAATVGIALFGWWVTVQDHLFDAQPQLSAALVGCVIADAAAVGALAGAWVMAAGPESVAAPR